MIINKQLICEAPNIAELDYIPTDKEIYEWAIKGYLDNYYTNHRIKTLISIGKISKQKRSKRQQEWFDILVGYVFTVGNIELA